MRSFRCALFQHDWCPYQKGKFGHPPREEDEKTQGEDGHVTGVMHLQAKKCQGSHLEFLDFFEFVILASRTI